MGNQDGRSMRLGMYCFRIESMGLVRQKTPYFELCCAEMLTGAVLPFSIFVCAREDFSVSGISRPWRRIC